MQNPSKEHVSMDYRRLGQSGLWVSSLVLGTMTFGDGTDIATSDAIFHRALEAGINLIDTADLYAKGQTEEILSRLIAPCRHDILIATKGYFPLDANPNHRGNSRLHLTQAIEDSLKRLKTDYIDLYYLHHFDENVPLEETLRTLDDAIRAGKIRYVGFSNFSAWQIEKALCLQERYGLNRAVAIQPHYNLLKRQAESEIFPCAQAEHLGVMTYSPLAAGILTGKYLNGESGRMSHDKKYQARFSDIDAHAYAEKFVALAHEIGVSPASLAIAWTRANKAITAPIIGARTLSHLESALDALAIEIDDALYQRIAMLTPRPANALDRYEEQAKSAFDYV